MEKERRDSLTEKIIARFYKVHKDYLCNLSKSV